MQIEIRGRNTAVSDTLRKHAEERFNKIGKQVSERARLEVELRVERNPAVTAGKIVEANLYLKGVTLRVHEGSQDLSHSIDLVADKLARQVKRHRDKRRRRREQSSSKAAS